jgi:hypothetical protein
MGKGVTFDNDLLKMIFNATPIGNLCDNAASSPLTSLAVALHTADPTSGTMSSSEATYTSYARVSVLRNSSGWTVSGQTVVPFAVITFPTCTGGSNTITHWSVGYTGGGATKILYCGTITPSIAVSNGISPQLSIATIITEA